MPDANEQQGIFWYGDIESNFLGHQMSEIYRDRVFAPYIEKKGLNVCLDIGGNIGLTVYYFSKHFKRVITLEPSQEHFQNLTRMVMFNKIENVTLINKALYIKPGMFDLFHNRNRTMYSLHTAVNDSSTPSEKVEAITLKQLFDQEKLDEVDFMKVDIEGSEFEILSHSDFKELAPKIKTVIVESHKWAGRHPNQLIDALKMYGYQVKPVESSADLLVATR